MRLFTIGDLHLSFGVPDKPMDIFGGWKDYQNLLEQNWLERIAPEDTVVLAGDFSWGMTLAQAEAYLQEKIHPDFSRLWTQDWNPLCSCTIRRSTERR